MPVSTHAVAPVLSAQKDSSPLQAPSLLDGISFTQVDLEKALHEAAAYRTHFFAVTHATSAHGLRCHTVPDWAPRLVSSAGVVQAVLDKIGSKTFSKRRPEDPSGHYAYVDAQYRAQKPLLFRLAVGPVKNIMCCGNRQHADLSEYLQLIQLSRVMMAVAAVYPFGIRVEIVPDDMRAMYANRCPQCYVACYITSLKTMVARLGFGDWVSVMDGQSDLYHRYATESFRDAAEEKIRTWKEADPEGFAARWLPACDNAEKNFNIELMIPTEKDIHDAAWRYLVAHQSEVLSGMWSTDHVFPLVYAHHPNNYQLYTIGYKKTKLPWQISLPTHLVQDVPQVFSAC